MSGHQPPRPVRLFLWGFLAAVLLAVGIGAMLAPRWGGVAGRGEPPPVLSELPPFELTERDGSTVTLARLAGRPWVAAFIYTRCPGPCPRMTERMKGLGGLAARGLGFRRVSITVDPEHDRPEVLAEYARSFGVEGTDWLFATGEAETIYRLARDGFKLAVDPSPSTAAQATHGPLLHSTRFVLVDASGRIRGYYDAFAAGDLDRLARDLASLSRPG